MPQFNFAEKGELATSAEDMVSRNLIANSSHQYNQYWVAAQHTDQLSLTRTSSEDNCENFVTVRVL